MASSFINRKVVQTILHAFDFARFIDRPLNQFITIRFDNISPEEAPKAFSAVRAKCSDWLQHKQRSMGLEVEPPYYVYSFENPANDTLHVHWVAHVPAQFEAEFAEKLSQWITRSTKVAPEGQDVCIDEVDPYTDKSLGKYILKGVDPHYADHFYIEASEQGPVFGRRATASRALQREARKKAGFVAKKHRHLWKTKKHGKAA